MGLTKLEQRKEGMDDERRRNEREGQEGKARERKE
jgi:hypothetical protein